MRAGRSIVYPVGSGGGPSNFMVTSRPSPGSDENDTSSSVTAAARLLHNPMAITPTQTLSFLNIASLDPTTFCSCMFRSIILFALPCLILHSVTGSVGARPNHPDRLERFRPAQSGFL